MTPTATNLNEAVSSIREKIKSSNIERHELAKQLTQIVADAQGLLGELGEAQVPLQRRRGPGRPAGKRGPGRPKGSGTKKRRKMSAAARAKISAAQKARWAKQKAGAKK